MRFFTKENGLLNYVNVYFEDSNGVLWLGGYRGLAFIKNDTIRFLKNTKNEIISLRVNIIKEDSKKNLWIGSDRGIYVYTNERTWKQFNIKNGLSGPSNYTIEIGEDFEGKIWALTKKNNVKYFISKIDPENWSIETIPTDKFIGNIFYYIIESSNKDLWFVANGQVLKYSQ